MIQTGLRRAADLRRTLVEIALEWQERFGVAPAITCAVSEFDAAMLAGMTEEEYCATCVSRTAVTRGVDFIHCGRRYQVKANRPSGRPGSVVTLVAKPQNLDWDLLIWVLYDREYRMVEAWEWTVAEYRERFETVKRLSPKDMRFGRRLYPSESPA